MPLGDYLVGLALFACTTGALIAVASIVVRRRLAYVRGAARAVAWGVVFLAALIGVQLVPGMLGVLSRWTVPVAALLLLAVVALRVRPADIADGAAVADDPRPPPSGILSWALAAIGVGAPALWLAAAEWRGSVRASDSVDTLTFHIPNMAAWIQGGSFWQVDQFVPVWSLGNYPQNGDVAFLAAVLPWRNDAFVKLANVPFVVLLALAVYALAVELRAPRATAALAAALVPTVPIAVTIAVGTTMPDLFLAAGFAAGALFLVRAFRTGRRSDVVVAGVALGLAFGAKWNGVTTVAAALVVWGGAWLMSRRPLPLLLRRSGLLVGCVLAAGGFWLLRNWVMSGNPVIPVRVGVGGLTLFGAPPDEIRTCTGFRIVDYAGDGHVWSTYLWPGWRESLGPPALAALLGALLAAAMAVRAWRAPGQRREAATVSALVACVALLFVAYALTPYSALGPKGMPVVAGLQSRYLLPALALAAAAAAWGVGRLGRLRLLGEALLLVAVLDGVRLAFDVPHGVVLRVALALIAAGVAVWGVGRASSRVPGTRRVVLLGAVAALAAVLVAVAGQSRQRDFNRDRYRHQDAAIEWLLDHAPSGHRVALAGQWDVAGITPVLPAFGPQFRNRVGYPARSVQRVLRPYTRAADWDAAVRRGRYDLVLVGNAAPLHRGCFVPGTRTDWNAWARGAGYPVVARGAQVTLYRVPGSARGAS